MNVSSPRSEAVNAFMAETGIHFSFFTFLRSSGEMSEALSAEKHGFGRKSVSPRQGMASLKRRHSFWTLFTRRSSSSPAVWHRAENSVSARKKSSEVYRESALSDGPKWTGASKASLNSK